MPLAHVFQYEAIYWQRFAHDEQVSAVAALSAWMGAKTRTIHVLSLGGSAGTRMV